MGRILIQSAINAIPDEVIEVMPVLKRRIDLEAFNWILEVAASAVLDHELALAGE